MRDLDIDVDQPAWIDDKVHESALLPNCR